MQFGMFQRDHGGTGDLGLQHSSPFDAEGVHDETGHADLFAYHEIGGGEGCMGGEEQEEEGAIEGLHGGCRVVNVVAAGVVVVLVGVKWLMVVWSASFSELSGHCVGLCNGTLTFSHRSKVHPLKNFISR